MRMIILAVSDTGHAQNEVWLVVPVKYYHNNPLSNIVTYVQVTIVTWCCACFSVVWQPLLLPL